MTTATAAPAKERSNGKAPGRYYRTGMSYEELFDMYPTERSAEKWFEDQRWGKVGLYCPRCGCVDRCKKTPKQSMPYWCGACRRRFSVRIGTLLERSHVPYRKWVVAIYLHLSNLKGVSSVKLARYLKVTQKTAWFMLHRIREAFENQTPFKMVGPVEIDESYFGGLERNKHLDKKLNAGRGTVGKTAVVGIKDRQTKEIRAQVVPDTKADTLQGFVIAHTKKRAIKYTDENAAYEGLDTHQAVSHGTGEYVRRQVHINGMESFWAMMKRGFHGVYHRMSIAHLHRYVAEFSGRHNIRDKDTVDQIQDVFAGMIGKRLMYAHLIEKAEPEGEEGPPPETS